MPSQLPIATVCALDDIFKTSTSAQTTLPMSATREAASTQLETTAVTAMQATRDVYANQVRVYLRHYLKNLTNISSWNRVSTNSKLWWNYQLDSSLIWLSRFCIYVSDHINKTIFNRGLLKCIKISFQLRGKSTKMRAGHIAPLAIFG